MQEPQGYGVSLNSAAYKDSTLLLSMGPSL